ncbi:MAG: hypothetical protein WBB28_09485 [Crinalium sp.]
MNERDRKAAEKVKAATNGKSTASNGSTRASERTNEAGRNFSDRVDGAADNLKQSIKAQIVAKAVKGAFEDLANGDFGEIGEQYFDAFEQATSGFRDNTFEELQAELDPKFLLNSSDLSSNNLTKSLPVSTTIEAEAVVN